MAVSTVSRLLAKRNAHPEASPEFAERFAAGLEDCRVVHLGPGAHYLQEDHPDAIAGAIVELIDATEGLSASVAA